MTRLKNLDYRKYANELIAFCGIMCCFVGIEILFRIQPELRTANISVLDEVPILYDILWTAILSTCLRMIPWKQVRGVLYILIYIFLSIFLFSEYIYCRIFGRIYGVKTLQYTGEAKDFGGIVQMYFDKSSWILIAGIVIFGIVGWIFLNRQMPCSDNWKRPIVTGLSLILVCTGGILFIPKLFKETVNAEQGAFTYMYKKTVYNEWIDNKRAVGMFGAYEFLVRDIHLFLRGNSVSEEDIATLDLFFSQTEMDENDMTGIFKNKNLILVLMESIDDWLVNEETTPTMCRMMEEGIYFSNMYTPIFGSAATLNAEFCSYTGITAPADGTPLVNYTNHYFPYSLPHLLREEGYSAKAFHYNSSDFYNRRNIHNAVGFEEYISFLDYEEDEIAQRDCVLAENEEIYGKLIEDRPFFDFVITFSAHSSMGKSMPYSHEDDAIKIYPEYMGRFESEEMDSISAKARLTDDMFAELLARLEADGLLEDTVIIAYGDHYDYTIHDQDYLKELSDAQNVYELSKTPFFIWAKDLEPQEMTKVVNTTDIYPTICNLFGLDNRGYFTGNDMFDDNYEGYAYWQDGSWITSEGAFYNETGEQIGDVDAEKAAELQSMISKKLNVNQLILDTDFFRQEK